MSFTEYENYDAVGLAKLIRNGEVSAEEVLDESIERIERHNPVINAVVYKMYDQARQAIAAGLPDGPLRGVPFLLKDLNLFCAGVPLSNGCRIYHDFVPDHDATLVARHRAAGLVIMGKTNTPELGICVTTEPDLFGATRNPWNLEHSAGGSSGGSAAAVAAGCLPMAHATDGGGSIRIPAAQCGLFGLKPSRARVPCGPDIGEGLSSLGVNHCVSRSVRDSAALLDATHGPEPGDPYAAPAPTRAFSQELGADPGKLRIAMVDTTFAGKALHSDCLAAIEAAATLCADLGHHVELARPAIDIEIINHAWRVLAGASACNALTRRAKALGREVQTGDAEPISLLWAQEGQQRSAAELTRTIGAMHGVGRTLGRFLQDYDLILSSTMANPPLPLGRLDMGGDDLDAYIAEMMGEIPFTPLFNVSGGAAMSVPLYWNQDGLPIGVHFGGQLGDEPMLLRLAAQLEQAQPWSQRRP